MAKRTFRFGIQTSRADTDEAWADKARRIEELGFSTLFMPDHFSDQFSPVPALMAAADATTLLRIGTLVFDNDFRHPVVLAKDCATLDVLSGGRLELGIGAGWMRTDYDASGIAYDRPGVRISRLEESLTIMKGFFADGAVSFAGKHYNITNYEGQPKPAQKPHPPILIGGGAQRILSLAAREADIVGVNFSLEQGAVNREVLQTGDAASTDEKMTWIRDAAGARYDDIELNVTVFVAVVTDDQDKMAERIAPAYGMSPAEVLDSPHVLVGSIDQIVATIEARRERYGFSYTVFSGDVYEQMAPVVARLADK
jgi:probable F420-dependent oxidoreductase